jgi:hypothetical protein
LIYVRSFESKFALLAMVYDSGKMKAKTALPTPPTIQRCTIRHFEQALSLAWLFSRTCICLVVDAVLRVCKSFVG